MNHKTKGTHIIADLYGIKKELLDDISLLSLLGRTAIAISGAKLVDWTFKKFQPSGVTLLFLLEESHLSFHTYPDSEPENSTGFLALDIYCCGDADPNVAVDFIIDNLKPDPSRVYRQMFIRGVEQVRR